MPTEEIAKLLPLIGTGSGAGVVVVTYFFLKALRKVSDSLDGLKEEFHEMNVNVRLVLDRTARLEERAKEDDHDIKELFGRVISLETHL